MNKKLLTLAVAAAMAAPAIAPSTASAEAILYGKVNVSLDYIDVDQNATFFRPGVGTSGTGNTHSPNFNMTTFVNGNTAGYDTLANLGSYAARPYQINPLSATPTTNQWKVPQAPNPGIAGPASPVYGNGSLANNTLTQQSRAAYNAASINTLRSLYPQNALTAAQTAGLAATAVYGEDTAYTAAVAAGRKAGQQAYDAAINANPTDLAAANLAASNAYDKAAAGPWDKYKSNFTSAQDAAFATAGPKAGYNGMQAYFAGQQARLTNDLAIGNITLAQYNAQTQRLEGLAGIAAQSAAIGAFRAGTKFKGWGMDTSWQGPSDRIGVKGSEDLGNGLKAIYQVEIGVDITNATRDDNIANGNRGSATANSGFAFRNTFVGLAGDWGTFLMGRHDTPLKISTAKLDLFSDTLADYNNTIGFQDIRADSAVAYISPSWSGFQLAAAIVPQGGATALGVYNQDEDTLAGAYSLAAIYKNGPFYGSVAYEALESENFAADNNNYQLLYGQNAKSDTKWRVGLGLLDWNGFSLTGIYEQRSNILGAPEDADGNFFQVQAGYAFGNNMIKAMWGRADLNRCADPNAAGFRYTCPSGALGQYFAESILVQNAEKNSWAVGYDYNFSKRTQAFLLYTDVQDKIEDANWSGFSIGMMHSF